MRRTATTTQIAAFALFSFGIVIAALMAFRSAAYAHHADILAWGFTFDLAISIPFFYWLFVVRTGIARPVTLAPLFIVSVLLAGLIVPSDQQDFLRQLRFMAAPLEVLVISLVARHLYKDRNSLAVRIATFEVSTLYYALFCWRREAPPGFTTHKRVGWGSIVAGIILMIVAESIAVHLFLLQWSVVVAWTITGLDIYGILWLIGDYHAIRLRPITIEDGVLRVRQGLRYSADIPLTNIAAVERISGEWKRRKDEINLAILEDPQLLIRLREPQIATGLMGIEREITAIAILPDEPERFEAAIGLSLDRACAAPE